MHSRSVPLASQSVALVQIVTARFCVFLLLFSLISRPFRNFCLSFQTVYYLLCPHELRSAGKIVLAHDRLMYTKFLPLGTLTMRANYVVDLVKLQLVASTQSYTLTPMKHRTVCSLNLELSLMNKHYCLCKNGFCRRRKLRRFSLVLSRKSGRRQTI